MIIFFRIFRNSGALLSIYSHLFLVSGILRINSTSMHGSIVLVWHQNAISCETPFILVSKYEGLLWHFSCVEKLFLLCVGLSIERTMAEESMSCPFPHSAQLCKRPNFLVWSWTSNFKLYRNITWKSSSKIYRDCQNYRNAKQTGSSFPDPCTTFLCVFFIKNCAQFHSSKFTFQLQNHTPYITFCSKLGYFRLQAI